MYPNYYEKQIKVIYGLGSDSKKKTYVYMGAVGPLKDLLLALTLIHHQKPNLHCCLSCP